MPRLALAALALCACTPAPRPQEAEPPAPPPVAVAEPPAPPPVAAPEPSEPDDGDDDDRCVCPRPASATAPADDDPPDEDDDEDADKRRKRAKQTIPRALAARLRAALPDLRPACDVTLSGPCAVRGDLDGDGKADDVVLVRASSGAGGLAILRATGEAELLGAGVRGQCWTTTEVADMDGTSDVEPCPTEIDVDLAWIAHWELHPRKLGKAGPEVTNPRKKRGYPAPGAVGDGLLVSGSDAAAVLYRTADGWTLMHLGF